jgi:Uma2 family endonuclease
MTLSEYLSTPEVVLPQELIDGVLRVADAPLVHHQRTVLKLALALERYLGPRAAGEVFIAPVDVILDADRPLVLQPDLLVVSNERSAIVRERIYGAPDVVVEVLSPLPRIGALQERVQWFAHYGVREIWLYDQSRRQMRVLECGDGSVRRSTPFEGHEEVRSAVLPDFRPLVAMLC